LYEALDDWGFDGFVIADDTGIAMLEGRHHVAASPSDAIRQWFNAGMFTLIGRFTVADRSILKVA
jgi:beta-glucosidase-like glycosyl hydrolase